jgi:hypothetical protein
MKSRKIPVFLIITKSMFLELEEKPSGNMLISTMKSPHLINALIFFKKDKDP